MSGIYQNKGAPGITTFSNTIEGTDESKGDENDGGSAIDKQDINNRANDTDPKMRGQKVNSIMNTGSQGSVDEMKMTMND